MWSKMVSSILKSGRDNNINDEKLIVTDAAMITTTIAPETTATAATNDETNDNTTRSLRVSSRRHTKSPPTKSNTKSKTKSNTKSKTNKPPKEDTSLEFIWICTECREAECITHPDSPLLVCEGPCARPFHYPCAGLPSLPASDELWICHDCQESRHECCVCHEYGEDGIDVYKCEKKDCGLFYHEACLNMYDVEIEEVSMAVTTSRMKKIANHNSNDDDSNEDVCSDTAMDIESGGDRETLDKKITGTAITRPKFICPAHSCWTCSGGMPPSEEDMMNVSEETSSRNNHERSNEGDDNTRKNQQAGKKKGKKRGKKSTTDNAFSEKKEKRLFRCLNCPNAYHISCIPPSCKFHELALLCHEHASSCKLPYLDVENSCQKSIEDRADRMIEALERKRKTKSNVDKDELSPLSRKRMKLMQSDQHNPFLLGKGFMNGDTSTPYEKSIANLLSTNDKLQSAGFSKKVLSSFCLPCGMQQEVYSKPPVYTQIHSNRYDPNHRPKRHAPSGEVCQCDVGKDKDVDVKICDEHCINRISGIECVGDMMKKQGEKNSYLNCRSGPNCGNRVVGQKRSAKCRPKREQGKGWGLVPLNGVKKGELVQEYVGEIIDEKMKCERLEAWAKEHPNDPNFYIMALEPGWYIDAREKGNLSRFINHSCQPNCHLLPVNVGGHMRVGVVASRNIQPGEFLSYDYHFDTQDGDKFVCRCGAKKCRGTMKEGQFVEDDNDKKLNKSERWIVAKSKLDRDKKFLDDIKKAELVRLHQISATLPGEKPNASNIIASGPEVAIMEKGRRYNVFLKRNVIAGSNLYSRYWRINAKNKK